MKEIKQILVITLSNLGDVIMTTPVMTSLKEATPNAKMTVVVGPKAKGLLERSTLIQNLVVYDKKAALSEKIKFLKELRKNKYDLVVDLRNTAIPFLVSCKKRSPVFRSHKKRNKREAHLEVLEWMKLPITEAKPFDFFHEEDLKHLFNKLEKKSIPEREGWILVAPGAASERKRWSAENFREVVKHLALETQKSVLLVGAPEERKITEEVVHNMPLNVKEVCGETSLRESAALISKASLVICNDSAMMHLAFELGRPTVGIFGPTDHMKYGHEGPHFRLARETSDNSKLPLGHPQNDNFYGLKSEKVIKLAEELLREYENITTS